MAMFNNGGDQSDSEKTEKLICQFRDQAKSTIGGGPGSRISTPIHSPIPSEHGSNHGSMNFISGSEIGDECANMTEMPSLEYSTSAVLFYCKRKILLPYFKLLCLLGWRPIRIGDDFNFMTKFVSRVYLSCLLMFLLIGYVLQFTSCFRRDKMMMLGNRGCHDVMVGAYILPCFLHFSGYVVALYVFRIAEGEQLQTLLEKVFLQMFHSHTSLASQPKLLKTLRMYACMAFLWLMLSVATHVLRFMTPPDFGWMEPEDFDWQVVLTVVLALGAVFQDLIQMTIVVSYCVQCQLLIALTRCLGDRIREKSIQLTEAMKEIHEVATWLEYLNDEVSTMVCITLVLSGSMTVSCGSWFLTREARLSCWVTLAVNLMQLFLWGSCFFAPLLQACRLTAACRGVLKLGHHVRARPFGYTVIPIEVLDSFLIYVTTLNLRAKLFRIPVMPNYFFSLMTLLVFALVIFGMMQ